LEPIFGGMAAKAGTPPWGRTIKQVPLLAQARE
jgi:hypothetical protein